VVRTWIQNDSYFYRLRAQQAENLHGWPTIWLLVLVFCLWHWGSRNNITKIVLLHFQLRISSKFKHRNIHTWYSNKKWISTRICPTHLLPMGSLLSFFDLCCHYVNTTVLLYRWCIFQDKIQLALVTLTYNVKKNLTFLPGNSMYCPLVNRNAYNVE
jgi:hypothetical protein